MALKRGRAVHFTLMLALGLFFYLAFIFFVVRADLGKVMKLFSSIQPYYLIQALLFDTGFIFFYGVAWFFIVRTITKKVPLMQSIIVVIISWFGDMLIPAAFITGEAIRLLFLKIRYNIDVSKTAATILVHRLLSTVAFVLFIILGSIYLVLHGVEISRNVYIQIGFFTALAVALVAFCVLILFRLDLLECIFEAILRKITPHLEKREWLKKYKGHIEQGLKSFEYSVDMIKRKNLNVACSFIALVTQWICGIMVPYTFFHAINTPVSFWALSMAYPMYGVIDNIPFGIPVNAGVFEAAMISTFILLGINREAAVTVTMLTRFVTVVYEALLTGTITVLLGPRIFQLDFQTFKQQVLKQIITKNQRKNSQQSD